MKMGIIIQARMSSHRYPGKVLCDINGKPMLQYLLDGLKHCKFKNKIVVASSKERSDDPIVKFCKEYGATCYRGSLDNVAKRFKEVIDIYKFDSFVRISADSPLLDYRIILKAISIFKKNNLDIVTNIYPRSYPKGQSVELIKSSVFIDNYYNFKDEEDFEHVTKYFYKNNEEFNIYNFSAKEDYSSYKLTVDEKKDKVIIENIIRLMKKPHWRYTVDDIVKLYKKAI